MRRKREAQEGKRVRASGEDGEVDAMTDRALVCDVDAAANDLVGAYDQAGGGGRGYE